MDLELAYALLSMLVLLAGCCSTAMQYRSSPPPKVQESATQASHARDTHMISQIHRAHRVISRTRRWRARYNHQPPRSLSRSRYLVPDPPAFGVIHTGSRPIIGDHIYLTRCMVMSTRHCPHEDIRLQAACCPCAARTAAARIRVRQPCLATPRPSGGLKATQCALLRC